MKSRPEKNVHRDSRIFANLGNNHLVAIGLHLLLVGLAIMLVMVISSGVSSVNAERAKLVPPGCPSATWMPSVAITLDVTLQRPNDPPPDPSWAVPVHFALYPPGDPNTICHEWDLTLDQWGNWSDNLALFMGLYDARLKNPHTLRNVKVNVDIAGPTTIDMGTLLEGDAKPDNWVKGEDFALLQAAYFKAKGETGFDPGADFDEDGWIGCRDFSLLRMNYWTKGDIPVP